MGTNEYSQPASKSSWDSQDFGDVNMVVKMTHFHKSSQPQWVNQKYGRIRDGRFLSWPRPRLLTPISAARWRTPSSNVGLNYLRIFLLL